MPATTTNFGWPTPLGTEPATGPANLLALAAQIDTKMKQLDDWARAVGADAGDTGWITLTLGASWGAVANYPVQIKKVGKGVKIRGMTKFVTGAYTNPICTITAPFRPTQNEWLQVTITPAVGPASVQPMVSASTGDIAIIAGYTTGTMAANQTWSLSGFWFVG